MSTANNSKQTSSKRTNTDGSARADQMEARLIERFGTERPFAVPEGYFDQLPGRVMHRIVQRKRRSMVWRWAAAAAVLVGCVAAGGMLLESRHNDRQISETEKIQYIEDALDYSMIDNMSIASYLTEAE